MNHREDWAMISHLLCGHMTRLLETRGNGPMFTLRTHDPSIGSTWRDLFESSQGKGPLFTRVYVTFANGPK
jgi:hypothetical protein